MAEFVRRVVAKGERRQTALDERGKDWMMAYPAIWEYMTLEEHEDGAARERSLLMILVEDGIVKGCVQDRDQGQSLWASGTGVPGVLEALDRHLQEGTGEWRQMRQQGNGKAPRKGGK